MTLDPQTLLLAMFLVVSLTAAACLPIWFQDHTQKAILWLAAAAGLFCLGMVGRIMLPFVPAIAFSNSAVLISYGLIWTGCRSLRERPAQVFFIALPAIIWLCLCFIPEFLASLSLRIGLNGFFILFPLSLAMREVWLIRRGGTIIRIWILFILGIQALVTLVRSIGVFTSPRIANVPFASIPGIVPVMIDTVGFTLLLGFGLVALNKELSDSRYRDAARNDFMTGVGNRRHFEETLQRYFRRAAKSGQPLALIMIDVDEFKIYNDLYGHPMGDRCLRALTQVFIDACRPGDVVGRYGGEEFAVLLPNTNSQLAFSIARRMLLQVRDLGLEHAMRPGGVVTISQGIASVVPDSQQTPGDLVETADRALYRAKQQGRDRICGASDGGELTTFPRAVRIR